MKQLTRVWIVTKEAVGRWSQDECYRLGASLSYYAVFSIFPLLLLCTTVVGFVVGHHARARDQLLDYVSKSGVPELRPLLDETLASMEAHSTARGVGAIVGIATLVFGASAVFSELEASLNTIWRAPAPPKRSFWRTVLGAVKDKAVAFVVVIGAALALLVSLLVSAVLTSIDSAANHLVESPGLWLLVETAGSVALLTLFLAAMYRMLPRAPVQWRDVLGGALLAALLFAGLKRLFAWYLGHIGSYAAYGAVGGVLGLLAWIYLASLVLFLGAEFARVYAERYGSVASSTTLAHPSELDEQGHTIDQGSGKPGGRTKRHSFA